LILPLKLADTEQHQLTPPGHQLNLPHPHASIPAGGNNDGLVNEQDFIEFLSDNSHIRFFSFIAPIY
jgi:hypothetical protein